MGEAHLPQGLEDAELISRSPNVPTSESHLARRFTASGLVALEGRPSGDAHSVSKRTVVMPKPAVLTRTA